MSDDDLHRLRATMSELAEHGGSTDLYERALTGSRRLGRRRAVMSTSTVAVAVLAVAVPIGLVQQRDSAPLPTATLAQSPTMSPSPATTSTSTSTSTTPTSTATTAASAAPSSPSPSVSRPPARPSTPSSPSPSHAANGCPVSTSTLTKVAGLDSGWKLDAGSIACKQNWATASLIAPTPEQQGDGLMFFKYHPTTGKWVNKGEGSSVFCSDMGIPESTGFCIPG